MTSRVFRPRADERQAAHHPAIAGRVVALVGRLALARVGRPRLVAAERLPGAVNPAVLNPVPRRFARAEDRGEEALHKSERREVRRASIVMA